MNGLDGTMRHALDALLDCCGIYSAIRDAEGRVVDLRVDYVNDAACIANGMSRDSQQGRGLCELLPAHRTSGLLDEYVRVIETGAPLRKESLMYRDSYAGKVLTRAFDLAVARLGDGIIASWRDITERKAAELELADNQVRLQLARDAAGIGIHDFNVVTGEIRWDARVRELWGVGADEPITFDTFMAGLHPDDRAPTQRAVDAALDPRGPRTYHAEYRVIRRTDRRLFHVVATGLVGFDGDRATRLVGTVQDVTGLRVAEEAMKASELRARRLWESGLVGIIYWDLGGRILDANQAFLDMLGHDRAALDRGEINWRTLTPPGWDEVDQRAVDQLLTRGVSEQFEKQYLHRDGHPVDVLLGSARFTADASQGVTMVLDISARKRAEAEQARVTARLLEEERRRAAFAEHMVGIVSHDLRNPLQAIGMGVDVLLRNDQLDAQALRALQRVRASSERARRMVHDLLDFTQARLGDGLVVRPARADLSAIIEGVAEELRAAHPQRDIQVKVPEHLVGHWDPDRLAQVVSNLTGNALHHGSPTTPVRIEAGLLDGKTAVVEVHNHGEPIPPAVIPSLFEPLRRGAEGTSPRRSIGLGLFIVEQIVKRHGGHVEVSSAPATGTSFKVVLPTSRD